MQWLVVSESSSQRCLHNSVYAMLSFLLSESVNETCYVYMVAIVSSDPFWLMVSKGLLLYVMPCFQRWYPCIFVICVVTRTSLQSSAFLNADFRDLVNSLSPYLLLFCCHVNLMLQRDPCIFWDIFMFYPSMSLFAIMEHPSLSQSISTFASLWIWEDRQLVCDFADVIVVDPCMLCLCSCHV